MGVQVPTRQTRGREGAHGSPASFPASPAPGDRELDAGHMMLGRDPLAEKLEDVRSPAVGTTGPERMGAQGRGRARAHWASVSPFVKCANEERFSQRPLCSGGFCPPAPPPISPRAQPCTLAAPQPGWALGCMANVTEHVLRSHPGPRKAPGPEAGGWAQQETGMGTGMGRALWGSAVPTWPRSAPTHPCHVFSPQGHHLPLRCGALDWE